MSVSQIYYYKQCSPVYTCGQKPDVSKAPKKTGKLKMPVPTEHFWEMINTISWTNLKKLESADIIESLKIIIEQDNDFVDNFNELCQKLARRCKIYNINGMANASEHIAMGKKHFEDTYISGSMQIIEINKDSLYHYLDKADS